MKSQQSGDCSVCSQLIVAVALIYRHYLIYRISELLPQSLKLQPFTDEEGVIEVKVNNITQHRFTVILIIFSLSSV